MFPLADDENDVLFRNEDISYLLVNGGFQKISDTSVKLISQYETDFEKGIGAEFLQVPNSIITKYITNDMANIKLFKDFQHDFYLELVCREDQLKKTRLDLMAYIFNTNRKHHTAVITTKPTNEFAGYYDMGDLRP